MNIARVIHCVSDETISRAPKQNNSQSSNLTKHPSLSLQGTGSRDALNRDEVYADRRIAK